MFLISSCSCLCSIHSSQVLSREWRCSWSSADRRCSNLIWVIDNFIAYQGATYIGGFTVLWTLVVVAVLLLRYAWASESTWNYRLISIEYLLMLYMKVCYRFVYDWTTFVIFAYISSVLFFQLSGTIHTCINPCGAESILEKQRKNCHFLYVKNTDLGQVVEIFPYRR